MKFKRRQLSLKNAIGFELTIESESSFCSQLKEASEGFKRLMMGDDLYFDGPTYFTYLPSDDIQDILVFTTLGNKLEQVKENTSGIFFQKSLNLINYKKTVLMNCLFSLLFFYYLSKKPCRGRESN